MGGWHGRGLALSMAVALAGCSQAPPLKLPDVPTGARWREAPASAEAAAGAGVAGAADAAEAAADAADAAADPGRLPADDGWWTIYGDSELDALQQRLLGDSPDLAAALARFDQARATSDLLRASQSPTLGVSLNLQRNRQSEQRPLRVLGPNSPDYYDSGHAGSRVRLRSRSLGTGP